MKLPSGPGEGALPRSQVIATLEAHGITVERVESLVIVTDDDDVMVYSWPELVSRFMIQRLSRRHGIAITDFYFPDS